MINAIITNKRGQTIIEAAIALASIMLVLAAISVAITTSLNNSEFIKNQTLAAKYAQQGMEYMTYLRNAEKPTVFEQRTGPYCMGQSGTLNASSAECDPVANPTDIIDNVFVRKVDFSQNALDLDCGGGTRVTVTVSWSSGKCDRNIQPYCHKSQLVSCFSRQSTQGNMP